LGTANGGRITREQWAMNAERKGKQNPNEDEEELGREPRGTPLRLAVPKMTTPGTAVGGLKLNRSGAVAHSVIDSERLLALSSLLRNGSREVEFFLLGKSMEPSLPDRSWIRVKLVRNDQFMAGQVLSYVLPGRVVAHRLVRSVKSWSKEYLITRGDATVCCDWPVPATSVLGIVTAFSTCDHWQPVGPLPERGFGFRCLAFLISSLVAGILMVSPSAATRTAKSIIRIRGMAERLMGHWNRCWPWVA
jgi:hypothetical protein